MLYHIHHSGNYQKLPLQVELLGVDHLQEPIQSPHGFPAFQWLFCTKGKGEFINNGQKGSSVPFWDRAAFLCHDGYEH